MTKDSKTGKTTRKARIMEMLKAGPMTATEIRLTDGGRSKHIQRSLAELRASGMVTRMEIPGSVGGRLRSRGIHNNCSYAYSLPKPAKLPKPAPFSSLNSRPQGRRIKGKIRAFDLMVAQMPEHGRITRKELLAACAHLPHPPSTISTAMTFLSCWGVATGNSKLGYTLTEKGRALRRKTRLHLMLEESLMRSRTILEAGHA